MLLDQGRNNSWWNEEMDPKQKQHLVVDVIGDGSKIWCCKEQYCIRTWNVRSMNQGKLEVVQKRCHFHYMGLECKSRKSRNTWSNRQILPWSTEWSRAKANRVLKREYTGHRKYPLPTTQEKTVHMDIPRWSITKSDWLYSLQPKMEKLYAVSKSKTRSWLWLRSWTPYCQIQI